METTIWGLGFRKAAVASGVNSSVGAARVFASGSGQVTAGGSRIHRGRRQRDACTVHTSFSGKFLVSPFTAPITLP